MINTIKNIRKLNNAELIFVCSNEDLIVEFEAKLNADLRSITVAREEKEALDKISKANYDMIVIDSAFESGFESFCFDLGKIAPMLPKIILVEFQGASSEQQIITSINASAYSMLSKPLRYEDLILSLTMCLNQTRRGDKFEFKDGIYYDEYRDQFYKQGGVLIEFTKLEKGLLKLLISRRGEITDYDIIKELVWKGKNMSIFTMRNVVNKIRQKTYYEIIRNYSNRGYIIDEQ